MLIDYQSYDLVYDYFDNCMCKAMSKTKAINRDKKIFTLNKNVKHVAGSDCGNINCKMSATVENMDTLLFPRTIQCYVDQLPNSYLFSNTVPTFSCNNHECFYY